MSKPTHETAAPKRMSLAQKIALASGVGAAITGIAPQSADATPIQSTTLPLSPPATTGTTSWDVDGDGTPDFRLNNFSAQASLTELGSARFVVPGSRAFEGFARLTAGFQVAATMTGSFKFLNAAQNYISITNVGAIGYDAGAQGWAMGDIGFFGFKFTNSSGVHYGWGQINIHGATGGLVIAQGFTLTDAYYNSVAGAPIAVGDTGSTAVPEIDPAAAGSVMSLVIGSLAMLERRRKLRGSAADTAA